MSLSIRDDKGQIILEKLVLYVSLLVVIIVGIYALWQIGAFKSLVGRKGTVGFSQVLVGDWVVSSQNKIFIELINEAEAPVRIMADGIHTQVESINCTAGPISSFELDSSESQIVELDCPGLSNKYKIGDFYQVDVSVSYLNSLTTNQHDSVGKLYGVLENLDEVSTTTSEGDDEWCSCGVVKCDNPDDFDAICEIPGCNYPGGTPEGLECSYCYNTRREGDLFANNWCWPKYNCKETCNTDAECNLEPWVIPPGYPEELLENPCPKCLKDDGTAPIPPETGTCKKDEDKDDPESKCGKECFSAGDFPPECIDEVGTTCPYCRWYDYTNILTTVVTREMACDGAGKCGQTCVEIGDLHQTYDECVNPLELGDEPCPWCNMSAGGATDGRCQQGECGKYCQSDEACNLGCEWCNITSQRCELGDCAKSCSSHDDCENGCGCCNEGKCVSCNIELELFVTNDTGGEILNSMEDTIVLRANALDKIGLEEVWISNVTLLYEEDIESARTKCMDLYADQNETITVRNVYEGLIDDPATDQWSKGNVSWLNFNPWKKDDCGGATNCVNLMTTTGHTNQSFHCFYAIAKEDSTLGRGVYSNMVCECIQVGYIEVYLISPKPPSPI